MTIQEVVRDHSHIYKADDEFRRAYQVAKRMTAPMAAALLKHMDGPQPVVVCHPKVSIRRALEVRRLIHYGTFRRPQWSHITVFGRRVVAILIERELQEADPSQRRAE